VEVWEEEIMIKAQDKTEEEKKKGGATSKSQVSRGKRYTPEEVWRWLDRRR
jgi:hypothetical protein